MTIYESGSKLIIGKAELTRILLFLSKSLESNERGQNQELLWYNKMSAMSKIKTECYRGTGKGDFKSFPGENDV